MLEAASIRGSNQKKVSDVQKIGSDETKTPLRDTVEVQMKPCPAKMCHTQLQMDARNSSRRMQLPTARFCKTCFPWQFSSLSSKHKWQSLTQLPRTVLPRQVRREQHSFLAKVCCCRIETTEKGSFDNRILS